MRHKERLGIVRHIKTGKVRQGHGKAGSAEQGNARYGRANVGKGKGKS